ncbi:MAG: metallophosphoesterase family protein [Lachnospiraceae bacterium]|nr:metallophosphoesterase family protein [Lachnospiraceae bacterium]
MKTRNIIIGFLLITFSILAVSFTIASSYNEVKHEYGATSYVLESDTDEYRSWEKTFSLEDTSNVTIQPGNDDNDLNFSWYSVSSKAPAVVISRYYDFSHSKTFTGTITNINRTNGKINYYAANHVSVNDYFKSNTVYYYKYTNDIKASEVEFSASYKYKTTANDTITAIAIGDAQIGASGWASSDAFYYEKMLNKAYECIPDASLILSAGDQIDYKTDNNDNGLRETQYAGLLHPDLVRSIPFVPTIGNHDTKGHDYSYHFNTPNSDLKYGKTNSGSDYYFRRGDALFIVLNSNNRKKSKHNALLKLATKENADAKWRIVIFHHDIYGTGDVHSNRTSANMRIIFAPLMDKYNIDLVLNGHDHCYSRSCSMLNGTAITAKSNHLINPVGTTYITLGSSSGSKMYNLADPKQHYIAERSNTVIPTFSKLTITKGTLSISTYDLDGKKYADDFSITKTINKTDELAFYKAALNKKAKKFTKKSYQKLVNKIEAFDNEFLYCDPSNDRGADEVARLYNTDLDPLSYYGYSIETNDALKDGYSSLLDKTRVDCPMMTQAKFKKMRKQIIKATNNLKKKK